MFLSKFVRPRCKCMQICCYFVTLQNNTSRLKNLWISPSVQQSRSVTQTIQLELFWMVSHFMQFAPNLSSPRTFRIYRDRRQTYRPFRRHDRFKSDFRQSIARITAKPCIQKLTFLCFRQVLILCMLCTDYCNNFTTYSYLFFPDTIMPVFVPSLVV